jgi:hypothetical protein
LLEKKTVMIWLPCRSRENTNLAHLFNCLGQSRKALSKRRVRPFDSRKETLESLVQIVAKANAQKDASTRHFDPVANDKTTVCRIVL